MTQKRIMIASGGTGGHFYPGLAVGRALKEQDVEVLFLVRRKDPAIDVLTSYQLSYQEIDLIGFPRSINPIRHISFIIKLLKSLFHTHRLMKAFMPNAVFGTGGYLTFPLICCAWCMHIPTALHDSNSRLGLVNRICGHFVNLFLLGLPINTPFKNTRLVSTPLRPEFAQPVNRTEVLSQLGLKPERATVLVMGGSQGARGLNNSLVYLVKNTPNFQFIHLTGTRWFETLKEQYANVSNVCVLPYSHEIYKLMKSADLTICRSGAGTIAELIACRLPAICVPFPHAAADHQYHNALVLVNAGAAQVIREGDQLTNQLQQHLSQMTPQRLQRMQDNYAKVPVPNPLTATSTIVQLLLNL